MSLRRYLALLRPHAGGLALASLLLGVSAALPGLAVVLLGQAFDEVLSGGDRGRLGLLCAGLVLLTTLEGGTSLVRTRMTKGIAWRVTSDLRRRLHRHLLDLSPRQQAGTGARLSALTHDVDEVQYGVSALVTALRNPLTLLFLGVTAASMAPGLTLTAAWWLPPIALVAVSSGWLLRRRASEQREARARLVGLAQEQLAGLRTVQAFGAEQDEHARFVERDETDRRARLRLEVDRLIPSIATRVVAVSGLAVLLWTGARQVLDGALPAGSLVAFGAALGLAMRPLAGLAEVWSLLQRSLAALSRVESALATAPDRVAPSAPATLPTGPLELCWRGVSADHGEGPVLHEVTLAARPREILALVGPTGAGKSTLLALVDRQLDPIDGEVTLGGVDVRRLEPAALRRAVATVRQEGFLFARSIADNVRLGRPGATDDEVRQALSLACADFVDDLPEGIGTPLDELGFRLSGGERQRLCVARALLCDAPVLLLDEATNQIDAATERALLEQLSTLRTDRTIVIVAHDAAVAEAADRVALIEGGRVVEEGTHEALIARGGAYCRLLGLGGSDPPGDVATP